MDEREHLEEFSALIESMAMPDHLKTALLEAMYHTYNVTPAEYKIPKGTPLPKDIQDGVDYLLKQQETNNANRGIEFDALQARAGLEKRARQYPDLYRMTPENKEHWDKKQAMLEKNTGMIMRNAQLNAMSQTAARKAYYRAIVKCVDRVYRHFGIKFDAEGYLAYINDHDTDKKHWVFDTTTANNIKFDRFGDMTSNEIVKKLTGENTALREVIARCDKFMHGLVDARKAGDETSYLMNQRINGMTSEAPKVQKVVNHMTADEQKAFDAREAKEKEQANRHNTLSANVGSIAALRQHFPRLPYASLYARFVRDADSEKVQKTPKPDESLCQFLYRIDMGNLSLGNFLNRYVDDINTAYPADAAAKALSQLQYTGYVDGAKKQAAEMGVDPSLQPLAALCIVIDSLRSFKEARPDIKIHLP